MKTIDLLLRYAIVAIAFQLACAWLHTFQSPWPLVDAFQIASSAEEQLFQSLGVRLPILSFSGVLACAEWIAYNAGCEFCFRAGRNSPLAVSGILWPRSPRPASLRRCG